MATKLRWGIIGSGSIAGAFAKGLATSKSGTLYAVGSRDKAKGAKFAKEYGAATSYGSYEALLADKKVQAVYVATPHPMHAEWVVKAAEAGKHILCEKPIGMNYAEAMAMVEAARENDVFLMEAFMYRCHPQIKKLVKLIQDRVIGDVRMIQATFSFHAGFNAESRIWKNALGGGGILDVGCYPVSLARLVAGVAQGQDFANPVEVKAVGQLNAQTHVDEYTAAVLKFPGGILAQVSTGVGLNQDNVARIYGTEGNILLPAPWGLGREGGTTQIIVRRYAEKEAQTISVKTPVSAYCLEAEVVAAHLKRRQAKSPAMSWDDTLGNMRTLDQWRLGIGLLYDAEKPGQVPTIRRRPPAARPKNNMQYGHIAGIAKPVSRLIIGADNTTFAPQAAVMWDDFYERGGTVWDTAHIYAGGQAETALGDWVRGRGMREQVVILDKGAHTPDCNPAGLRVQHHESLDRLKMDYVDIYMMHRDNLEIPVGEFIDVLNEQIKAGTMRVVGVSNWTLQRVEEANAWAKLNGKTGLVAVSNNLSLAWMVDPVWKGCIHSSDPASLAWFTRTQMPLMAWSSQARGFFLPGKAAPGKLDDAELARCWYSPENFQRLKRANEMAKKKRVLPINIALAYVLNQPFPTFALIGPRALNETRTSLPALDIKLTPKELRWLDSGQ